MCAVGTSSGQVALFDLRSSKPLTVKDHMYSSPIVDLKFKESDSQSGNTAVKVISRKLSYFRTKLLLKEVLKDAIKVAVHTHTVTCLVSSYS